MKTVNLNAKATTSGTNSVASTQSPALKAGAIEPSKGLDMDKEKTEDGKKVEVPTTDGTRKEELRQEPKVEKPALNLESTLKLVEELHRRKIHRDNLLNTISTLEEFEILIAEESQELDSVKFQACKLTIEDDDRNTFSTKNPVIIKAVADFVNRLCVTKLAEIEANIVIPA